MWMPNVKNGFKIISCTAKVRVGHDSLVGERLSESKPIKQPSRCTRKDGKSRTRSLVLGVRAESVIM